MKNLNIIVIALVLIVGGWFLFGSDKEPIVQVNENIAGQWQSVELESLVREFKDEGVLVDWFGGSEAATGTWALFTSADAPAYLLSNNDDEAVYLQINLTGEERDTLYYLVSEAEAETLKLNNLGPGGVLEFTKVQ